MFPLFYPSP